MSFVFEVPSHELPARDPKLPQMKQRNLGVLNFTTFCPKDRGPKTQNSKMLGPLNENIKVKIYSFIDSDDSWTNNKLEKQIFFMEKNNFVFTYTDYTPFFENNGKKKVKKRTHLKNFFNYKTFVKNSSINTTTMIIARSILGSHKFRKIKLLEDYLFKCKLLKDNNIAKKLDENLAFYRILNKSRSSQRLKNVYWLWHVNKNFNKLNFFDNIISTFFISINSIKKYGIK